MQFPIPNARKATTATTIAALLMMAWGATGPARGGDTTMFTDVTAMAGIQAPLTQDKPAGGIGVGDFNRDGWPDLFLTGYFEPNKLYFNTGQGGFQENPVIAAQIAMPGSRCTGVAVADPDNDGWSDIYLVCNGDNHLLRNREGIGFESETPALFNHAERSEAAVWADFNHDGVLDLVVAAHPRAFPYDENDPDNYDRILISTGIGDYVDLAPSLSIDTPLAATLALVAADLDLDGRMDLYFANDRHDGNTLLLNRGPGCGGWCFDDVSEATGARRPAYSMGIAVSDYDRDGDVDLYYSSIDEQILLVNHADGAGDPVYIEGQIGADVNAPGIGWGTIFLDVDNDGLEDIYLAIAGPSGANGDRLYLQQPEGGFVAFGPNSGLNQPLATEAAARIDYDRDGRMDLVLGHSNRDYRLYRNIDSDSGNWLGVELVGFAPINRDAIGTRVEVVTGDGLRRIGERRAGESRGATHDPALHFGLGAHTRADIVIHWPDGNTTTLAGRESGRYHRVLYPSSIPLFTDGFEP